MSPTRRLTCAIALSPALVTAACGGTDRVEVETPSDPNRTESTVTATTAGPTPEGPADRLAVVTDEGGLCPTGVCVSTFEFRVDGTWLTTTEAGEMTEGQLDVSALVGLVPSVDQDEVVTGPFTGECPTAFDGFERHYFVLEPGTAEPVLSILTCRDAVDETADVIAEIDRLVDAVRLDLSEG